MQPRFPNLAFLHAGGSLAEPIIFRDGGWFSIEYDTAPFLPAGALCAMIEVCTATNAEITERAAHGESHFDVMDEHTSRMWFSDRVSFRKSWEIARRIAAGQLILSDTPAGELGGFVADGQAVDRFRGVFSAHHIRRSENGARPARTYMRVEDHPCQITDDEWGHYAKVAGLTADAVAALKASHAEEMAKIDPDFFPDPEHRVAWRRGMIDAALMYGCPRKQGHTELHLAQSAPLGHGNKLAGGWT